MTALPSQAPTTSSDASCDFAPIAPHKFVVLSLCTFGFYEVVWNYRNWKRIRARTNEDISPAGRAFFSGIWSFSLFHRIHDRAGRAGVAPTWNPSLLAVGYLVLSLCVRLPGAWWLVSILNWVPVLPVVQTVRQINSTSPAPEAENGSYDLMNLGAIAIGGAVTLLAVFGSFFPDFGGA